MASRPRDRPPVVGFIANFQGPTNNLTAPDDVETAVEDMFLTLERDMLLNLAHQFKTELGIVNPPQAYTFTGVSHTPLGPSHPVKDFIHAIMDQAKKEDCEAILVLRCWDSITAHKESFMQIFARCIDEFDLRVRLKIFDRSTYQIENVNHFIDVDPADVYMRLAGYFDPDDPTAGGFEPNTVLFVEKLEEICNAGPRIWPNLEFFDDFFNCWYSLLN